MTQNQNNLEVLKHKAVSMKLAFILFYLKINAHLLFIQVKTEKEFLKQGGTLTEQVSKTCSSFFSCSCSALFG